MLWQRKQYSNCFLIRKHDVRCPLITLVSCKCLFSLGHSLACKKDKNLPLFDTLYTLKMEEKMKNSSLVLLIRLFKLILNLVKTVNTSFNFFFQSRCNFKIRCLKGFSVYCIHPGTNLLIPVYKSGRPTKIKQPQN